jgi:hypothetical protein
MAGLDPAIHVLPIAHQDVDARVKPAHDEREIPPKAESLDVGQWPTAFLRNSRPRSVFRGQSG